MKLFFLSLLIFTNAIGAENSNSDLINKSLASAMDMFSVASIKYEKGELTKEQYIKIALQVNKLSEISKSANSTRPVLAPIPPSSYTSESDSESNRVAVAKIKADYLAFLKSTKVNDVRDWGNGKLYRRAYGAFYVDSYDGDSVYFHDMSIEDLDYQRLAEINRSIRKFWNEKYGFQLYVPGVVYLMSADQSSQPAYSKKILDWLKQMNNSLKVSQSKTWNKMTIIRTSNPGCVMILSADGIDNVSVCETDNFDKIIPDSPYLAKIAAQYWGYTATKK